MPIRRSLVESGLGAGSAAQQILGALERGIRVDRQGVGALHRGLGDFDGGGLRVQA
jgi:hypothetical protein